MSRASSRRSRWSPTDRRLRLRRATVAKLAHDPLEHRLVELTTNCRGNLGNKFRDPTESRRACSSWVSVGGTVSRKRPSCRRQTRARAPRRTTERRHPARRDFLRIVDGDLAGRGRQRQLPGLRVRQLAEGDVQRLVAVPRPLKTRSCRPQDQQARSDGGGGHAVQQLQRGRVRPMEILEHHHERPVRRRGTDQVDEPLEQQLPQLDRRQFDDRKAAGRLQVQYARPGQG